MNELPWEEVSLSDDLANTRITRRAKGDFSLPADTFRAVLDRVAMFEREDITEAEALRVLQRIVSAEGAGPTRLLGVAALAIVMLERARR